jgi:uncharacterized protein
MRIVRAADLVATPWKNGGGVTREIVAHPPGAGLDSFDWRLSMATVAQDGPFSAFPGIDRVLVLLDGDGLRLDFADGESRPLRPGDRLPFAADRAVTGRLTTGPVTDLNIMVRRDRLRLTVEETRVDGAAEVTGPVIFVLSGRVETEGGALGPRDTVLTDTPVRMTGTAHLLLIGISPV